MINIIKKIIFNVLVALYQPFVAALVMSILLMTVHIFAKEFGYKQICQKWTNLLKTSVLFRRTFVLVFYTVMILFKTLFVRNIWDNPFFDVIGVWGLYNSNGELTTEIIENLVLFIPFTVLLLYCYQEKLVGNKIKWKKVFLQSVKIVFLFSLSIELLQVFFRVGTFQLSDLFYNTLGGFAGGLIYWSLYKIAHRKKDV